MDVPSNEDVRAEGSKFRTSRWFKRGWTLQELIAPLVVVFLSQDWEGLGTKDGLADLIQDITFIDREILTHKRALRGESVADRMRWASKRTTTRVEDEAYWLLGIFGITMPTLYGEGEYAFRRLQEEIIQRIPDQSLFAWGSPCLPITQEPSTIRVNFTPDSGTLFAPSPRFFASDCSKTIWATGDDVESIKLPVEEYTHTPYGIRTQLYLLPLKALNPHLYIIGDATWTWYFVVLGSQHVDDRRRLLSRLCYLRREKADVELLHVPGHSGQFSRHNALIFTLSLDDLARVMETGQLHIKTFYLPHPKPSVAERRLEGESNAMNLTLPTWAQAALRMYGYTVSNIRGLTEHHRNSSESSLTLFHASFNIHIRYRHMIMRPRDALVIEARVWILSPAPDGALLSDAAIQCSTPYTSAIWADKLPLSMTFPTRSVTLIADSGDKVLLRLGLDRTGPSDCNIRVEVAPAVPGTAGVGASLRPDWKDLLDVLDAPHETFNLTLPGSVERTLKMKGYSAHLELGQANAGGSHSHSLTISSDADSGFTIAVKYFQGLSSHITTANSPAYVVVGTRVTLESSIFNGGSDTYQDGPYGVDWINTGHWSLREQDVVLATPTGNFLTLRLAFDFAWQSEFYLHVDIEPRTSDRSNKPPAIWDLDGMHESVSLTLPGRVKRTLQTDGYEVRFEALDVDDEGNPARHRLTLSKVDPSFAIIIDYSHNLSTYRHQLQELTFQACVEVLPPHGVQDHTPVAPQSDSATMDWNAKDPHGDSRMWRPHLPGKDITLVLPTGRRLTLRLGFYLVWYSGYCVTVEILKPTRRDPPPVVPITSVEEGALHPVSPQPLHRGWTLLRKVLKVLKGSTIPSDIS